MIQRNWVMEDHNGIFSDGSLKPTNYFSPILDKFMIIHFLDYVHLNVEAHLEESSFISDFIKQDKLVVILYKESS